MTADDEEDAALMAELEKTNRELFTQASDGPASEERKPMDPDIVHSDNSSIRIVSRVLTTVA